MNTEFKAWLSNDITLKVCDIIIHPCPNFDGGLAKLRFKLGHG